MDFAWILAVVVVFAKLFLSDSKSTTHFTFMSNYCSDTVEVQDSLVIVLVPPANLRSDRNLDFIQCSLDLLAPKGHGLHVHFLHVSISPDQKHSDRLHLYEVNAKNDRQPMTPDQGLYGQLDRSILSSDYDGDKIGDYSTWERRLRIDYLGKPTNMHSGFRALITIISKSKSANDCPSQMTKCSAQPFCIPSSLVCDGYPNCGDQDLSDEKGCDPDHLVTDLLDRYSLLYDILVVTCVPVFIFIIIAVLLLCLSWRYMKKKYPLKDAPPVSYSATNGGQVEVYDDTYDPPSYNEVISEKVRFNMPPAYSTLDAIEKAGTVVIESDDDHHLPRGSGRRYQHGRLHPGMKDSNSSIDSAHSPGQQRAHVTPAARRPMIPHYDSSDDEETKYKHRRKGGKSKSKGKRRADDLCPNAIRKQTTISSELPLTSSPSASRIYSPSVPFVSFACPPLSAASSSSSVPLSSPSPPPGLIKSSPSTESEGLNAQKAARNNEAASSPSPSCTHHDDDDVAVLPICNNARNKKVKATTYDFPLHSDSSGVEADRKSETESGSWCQTKNDSKTESCTSLSDSRKSPASITGKTLTGEGIREDSSSKSSCHDDDNDDNKNHDQTEDQMGNKGDNKWGKSVDDDGDGDDRIIEDVYQEGGILPCDSYEIDLRSKEAVAVKTLGSSVV